MSRRRVIGHRICDIAPYAGAVTATDREEHARTARLDAEVRRLINAVSGGGTSLPSLDRADERAAGLSRAEQLFRFVPSG